MQVEPFVRVALTVKLVLAVTDCEVQAVVRLLKDKRVPELMIDPPPLTVTVPEVGE